MKRMTQKVPGMCYINVICPLSGVTLDCHFFDFQVMILISIFF